MWCSNQGGAWGTSCIVSSQHGKHVVTAPKTVLMLVLVVVFVCVQGPVWMVRFYEGEVAMDNKAAG